MPKYMKIVIDKNIPYLKESLEKMGHEVTAMPGVAIGHDEVIGADALFIRTRTRCDKNLLDGSKVRFIGTATIGYDHIDTRYCKENGITWSNAPGCNAGAVLQYVQAVIYSHHKNVKGLSLGVVGIGEVGSRVAEWGEKAGMTVYRNDPPKADQGMQELVTLEEIAEKCDIITFHPSLHEEGEHPSFHLADSKFFSQLKRKPLFINASRGPVTDSKALSDALDTGMISSAAIDVWENEPDIELKLLEKAWIATPHIAGYSLEGKYNATRIVLDAFADFAGIRHNIPMPALPDIDNAIKESENERDAVLKGYNPLKDTENLKKAPAEFEKLRNNYTLRREIPAFKTSDNI